MQINTYTSGAAEGWVYWQLNHNITGEIAPSTAFIIVKASLGWSTKYIKLAFEESPHFNSHNPTYTRMTKHRYKKLIKKYQYELSRFKYEDIAHYEESTL